MGVTTGTKVLVNAFTFDTVPAAIHHCQVKAILVEFTPELTIKMIIILIILILYTSNFLIIFKFKKNNLKNIY